MLELKVGLELILEIGFKLIIEFEIVFSVGARVRVRVKQPFTQSQLSKVIK
jgi:hypothetical protein